MAPTKKNAPKQEAAKLPVAAAAVAPATDDGAEMAPSEIPNADEPVVDLLETEVPPESPGTPWLAVPHMSDSEMEVEAFNVTAAGRAAMLLRFRINGQLTGLVHQIEKMYFNVQGKPGKEFVPR